MIVHAVDPGARWTAYVVRDTAAGDRGGLLAHDVVERPEGEHLDGWIRTCLAAVGGVPLGVDVSVVEGVTAPTPYGAGDGKVRITDPTHALATAHVVGALVAVGFDTVPPDGFGAPAPNRRILEATYPAALIGPRETTGSGKSRWQHLRAAWDLAAAGARQHRLRYGVG